jgi:hypothetical protein
MSSFMTCIPLYIVKVIGSGRISTVERLAFFKDMRNASCCVKLPVPIVQILDSADEIQPNYL